MKCFKYLVLSLLLALSLDCSAWTSNYLQNKIADHIFRGISYIAPTSLCIALARVTPIPSMTGATFYEANYTGYARGVLNPSNSNWLGTGGEVSGASNGTQGLIQSNTVITFGTQVQSGPSVVTAYAILDSCTIGSGNILFYGTFNIAKTLNIGDNAPAFAAHALTVQIQ